MFGLKSPGPIKSETVTVITVYWLKAQVIIDQVTFVALVEKKLTKLK